MKNHRRGIAGWALVCAVCAGAAAQPTNPVYVDDSPAAADTLARAPQLAASGNLGEAVRALRRILEEEPDRVVPASGGGPDVYTGVRRRVHRELLADPDLLNEYRRGAQGRAAELLAAGEVARVEQDYLLTTAGLEAALRLAQAQMERAEFESSRLTLEQLEDHPDRKAAGPGRVDAARLLRRLAGYLDRAVVWDRAEAWAREAGLAPEDRRGILPPPTASVRPMSPLGEGQAVARDSDIPPTALWTAAVEDGEIPADELEAAQTSAPERRRSGVPAASDQRLWIFPTVVGDTLLVNNGSTVRAWDRYTLEPRWTAQPPPGGLISQDEIDSVGEERRARRAVTREDTAGVTVAGGRVLATLGIATDGLRIGDDRVHAIDLGTGRVLWSAAPWADGGVLRDGSVRGPVLAGEGVAVVALRKSVQPRRVVSMYLVGLDLATGRERWSRLIGSAGALPNQRERRVAESAVLRDGIVYATDPLGVVAAVEAATGRPVWVRRVPSADVGYVGGPAGQMWETSSPVVEAWSLFVLSPDRDRVMEISRATGEILAERPAEALGRPAYLLGVAGTLCAVGRDRIAFVSMDELAAGRVSLSERIEAEGAIRGRVVVAGDTLLVPTIEGARLVDPFEPRESAGALALDRSGILLPADGQVIAVDDREIRSYLGWETADRLLSARMAANPADPRPAVSYADLAFRAGRTEGIIGATDRALAAIERDPGTEVNGAARARLFASLREMVEVGQAANAQGAPPLSPAQTDALVSRLGRAGATAEDRVVYLLCLGRSRSASGQAGPAVEAYQTVLGEPLLAEAAWSSLADPTEVVRAGDEATARVRALVIASGRRAYGPFDAEAAAARAALGGASGPALEGLARRYPVARGVVGVWHEAADAYERNGAAGEALAALGSALAAAEVGLAIGPEDMFGAIGNEARVDDPGADLGEAAGRLVSALARSDRPGAAAQTLWRVVEKWPQIGLTDRGATIDAGAMSNKLAAALTGPARPARIGIDLGVQDQHFADWEILRPLDPGALGAPEHVVMGSDTRGQVGLFGVDFGDEEVGGRRGGLRLLWTRAYQDLSPALLRSDPGAVYLAWMEPDGGNIRAIERVDAVGGRTRWRTGVPADLLPADPTLGQRLLDAGGAVVRLETRQGPRAITQMIVLFDGDAVVLVERTGRMAVLDAATGRVRGGAVSQVPMVFDATAGRGRVALTGIAAPALDGQDEAPSVVAVHALSDASLLRTIDDLGGQVRWVRLVGGRVLAALRTEVVARDLATGAEAWAMQVPEARDAWLSDAPGFEGSIFLLTHPDRELFHGSLDDGSASPVDVGGRLGAVSRIDAAPVAGGLALMNSRGVVIVGGDGRIAGMDALAEVDALAPPVAAEDSILALQRREVILQDRRPTYRLNLLSTTSASLQAAYDLVLWAVPSRIAVIDGRVLVTAGRMTVGYPAGE